jgi:NTE family protein
LRSRARPASDSSPLEARALGGDETVRRCGDTLRPAAPAPAPTAPTVGATFSGGGFRATLAALGAIRCLADAGLLGSLRYAASVSGGSIANALLARHWPALRARGFSSEAVDEFLIDPLVSRISGDSLKWSLIGSAWRTLGKPTRTDLLADRIDDWFLNGVLLEHLDPEVRWVVSAANIVTGVRFGFERDVVGDYVAGLASTRGTGLRLAQAVAASAAVPGMFAPWTLGGLPFPCAARSPVLLDGGVYDNTALEAFDSERYRDVFLVAMNAGGLLRPAAYGRLPVVRDLARANSLLYRQSTALRTRMMVERFKSGARVPDDHLLPEGARRGILVALSTDMPLPPDSPALSRWRSSFPEARTWDGGDLALLPTAFDKLPAGLCRRLIYRGWWLVGAALAHYHPSLAPEPRRTIPPPS